MNLAIIGFMSGVFTSLVIFGNKFTKKLIHDCLMNPKTGQFSRKNVTGFLCFIAAVVYCMYALVHDKTIQEFVVAIFMGACMTCLGISSWEKKNVVSQDPPKDELPKEG